MLSNATTTNFGFANLSNAVLAVNNSGQVVATSSIGTNILTGTLAIAHGGTGTSTAPGNGQLLIGDASGNYEFVSTSSLGIGGTTYGFTYPLQNSADVISLAFGTTTANAWSQLQ